ncbi:MAG: NUDIX domain-containing protein [Gemmatimonadaceae bacterium]
MSVKGVVFLEDRAILLRNERDEWELPGGKLEPTETPQDCCAREILEELSIRVSVDALLDCWMYGIRGGEKVLIVTYGCSLVSKTAVRMSSEHKAVGYFAPSELDALRMPEGYRASVRRWWNLRKSALAPSRSEEHGAR